MILAHRIELDLNNKQTSYMAKACGVARFACNWALAEWRKMYQEFKLDLFEQAQAFAEAILQERQGIRSEIYARRCVMELQKGDAVYYIPGYKGYHEAEVVGFDSVTMQYKYQAKIIIHFFR